LPPSAGAPAPSPPSLRALSRFPMLRMMRLTVTQSIAALRRMWSTFPNRRLRARPTVKKPARANPQMVKIRNPVSGEVPRFIDPRLRGSAGAYPGHPAHIYQLTLSRGASIMTVPEQVFAYPGRGREEVQPLLAANRVGFAVAWGFYAAVERRRCATGGPPAGGPPVAVVRAGRVLDLSPELRARGIGPGIKRSHLLDLCPEARLVEYTPERYQDAWEELLDILAGSVPAVEPVEVGRAFLDLTGLEPGLCRRIGREALARSHVIVGFGTGPTKLMARAAGLGLLRRERPPEPGETVAVPDTRDAGAFLASLPVSDLYPLPPGVTARLERLGLRTAAQVGEVPFEELVRQFGPAAAREIAAAAAGGRGDRVLSTWPLPFLKTVRRFEGGLRSREPLERVLSEVAGGFSGEMTAQGLASGELSLAFVGEGGQRLEASRRPARPLRSRAALLGGFQELADRLLAAWKHTDASGKSGRARPPRKPDPPMELEARAARLRPRPARQLDFSHLRGFASCRSGDGPAAAARLRPDILEAVEGLARRFGEKTVMVAADAAWEGSEAGARGCAGGGATHGRPTAGAASRRETLLSYYDPLRALSGVPGSHVQAR